jgi:phosphatidylglycerol lysyltransferase
MLLLVAGAAFSLLKGLAFETGSFLLLVAALLRMRKADFYRVAYPLLSPRNVLWLVAFLAALGGYAVIGALVHGGSASAQGLLAQLARGLEAPPFVRSLLTGVVAALSFLGWTLFAMPGPPLRLPSARDLEDARDFLERWGAAGFAHLLFTGDKYLFYSADHRSLVQFGVVRDRLVALGDPLGDPERLQNGIVEFRAFADRYDRVPVFHEVSDRHLHHYHDHGFALFKLGETARVSTEEFTLAGRRHSSLRHSARRAEREGAAFEVLHHPLASISTVRGSANNHVARRSGG